MKKTPKDTWLKCKRSIANNTLQNEFVLTVKVRSENSHSWFHINKKPVIRLKKQKKILQYKLL